MLKLNSIKDLKSGIYNPVFTTKTDVEGIRGFRNAIMSQKAGVISDYPEDFALYNVGEFNEETAEIKQDGSSLLIQGQQIKNEMENMLGKEEKND